MFWLIHLIVLFTFPFALILTIPLHIIINQNNKKSDDISKIATQLKESQDVSKLATQLELQRLANEPKEKHYSEVKNEEAIRQQSIDDKWNTAKKYLNEVKEGLIYINSKVLDDSRSKNGAEIALKEVFSQLGVSAITQSVLDNIVNQVNEDEAVRETERKEVEKQLQEERSTHEMERQEQKRLEQGVFEAEQIEYLCDEEQLEHLYDAVKASNYKKVVDILSLDKTTLRVEPEHKIQLQSIAKKRGDKKIFNIFNNP